MEFLPKPFECTPAPPYARRPASVGTYVIEGYGDHRALHQYIGVILNIRSKVEWGESIACGIAVCGERKRTSKLVL